MTGNRRRRLFLITCRGMKTASPAGCLNGVAYAIADNSDEAYGKVRRYLDEGDLGFSRERELDEVKLIAEECDFPECGVRLFS